jgi:hypothetical protein
VRASDDVIGRMIEAIGPPADRLTMCRSDLEALLPKLRRRWRELPPPGKARSALRDYAKALRNAKLHATKVARFRKVARLDATKKDLWWDEPSSFIADLEREIKSAEFYGDTLVVPRGSPRRDPNKKLATVMARDLLREYGKRATLTVDRPWLKLSSLLYEAITGIKDADLSGDCRHCDDLSGLRYIAR